MCYYRIHQAPKLTTMEKRKTHAKIHKETIANVRILREMRPIFGLENHGDKSIAIHIKLCIETKRDTEVVKIIYNLQKIDPKIPLTCHLSYLLNYLIKNYNQSEAEPKAERRELCK